MDSDLDPYNHSDNSGNQLNRIHNFVFDNPAVIFLLLLAVGVVLILGVNFYADLGPYQNTTLIIGLTQVVITGYLSFKILSIGKRDSEIPDLELSLVDVAELEAVDNDAISVVVTFEVKNTSYGRARIRDLELEDRWLVQDIEREDPKIPPAAWISKGKPTPIQLDKDQSVNVDVKVNGLRYLEELTILVDESRLGVVAYSPMISSISYVLNSKRHASREP